LPERLVNDQIWLALNPRNWFLKLKSRAPKIASQTGSRVRTSGAPDNHLASLEFPRTAEQGAIRPGLRKNPIARKKRTAVWGEEWDASLLAGAFLAEQSGLCTT